MENMYFQTRFVNLYNEYETVLFIRYIDDIVLKVAY